MNILDIVLNGNSCDILVKKGDEEIKYTLSLTNPNLGNYLERFLKKQKKLFVKAKEDMESDYKDIKLRNSFLTYGIGGLLAILLFIFTYYANEFIETLGFFGSIGILGVSSLINKTFTYESNPQKEARVNAIQDKINGIEKIKALSINKISEIEEMNRLEKEQRERETERRKKLALEEEAKRLYEIRRTETLISSKLLPHQRYILDEIVELACSLDEFKEKRNSSVMQVIYNEFLDIKKQDLYQNNLDILKKLRNKYVQKKNKKGRKI